MSQIGAKTPKNAYEEADIDNMEKFCPQKSKLCNDEISRYSRQLILPEIGVKGRK